MLEVLRGTGQVVGLTCSVLDLQLLNLLLEVNASLLRQLVHLSKARGKKEKEGKKDNPCHTPAGTQTAEKEEAKGFHSPDSLAVTVYTT